MLPCLGFHTRNNVNIDIAFNAKKLLNLIVSSLQQHVHMQLARESKTQSLNDPSSVLCLFHYILRTLVGPSSQSTIAIIATRYTYSLRSNITGLHHQLLPTGRLTA